MRIGNIDFVDEPKTARYPNLGHLIHTGVASIIGYAHADYDKKRVSIRPQHNTTETEGKKKGGQKGHQAYQRIVPSKARYSSFK